MGKHLALEESNEVYCVASRSVATIASMPRKEWCRNCGYDVPLSTGNLPLAHHRYVYLAVNDDEPAELTWMCEGVEANIRFVKSHSDDPDFEFCGTCREVV